MLMDPSRFSTVKWREPGPDRSTGCRRHGTQPSDLRWGGPMPQPTGNIGHAAGPARCGAGSQIRNRKRPADVVHAADNPQVTLFAQTGLAEPEAGTPIRCSLDARRRNFADCLRERRGADVRGCGSAKEVAVRLALARAAHVWCASFDGSVMLSVLGGALRILLSYWGSRSFRLCRAIRRVLWDSPRVSTRVLGFTLTVSLVWNPFGIAPAFRGRIDLTPCSKKAKEAPRVQAMPGECGLASAMPGNGASRVSNRCARGCRTFGAYAANLRHRRWIRCA
jgi:hypothetical protein